MAEDVHTARLLDAGVHHVLVQALRELRCTDAGASRTEEEHAPRVIGQCASRQEWACLVEILFGPSDRPLADRHEAVLRPFPLAHEQCAPLRIEITHVEPHELHAADARRVEHFEDRPIAQPER